MGVVYSSREIANGAIPQNGAHLEAAQKIIEEVPRVEGVDLTTVYGSVVDEDKHANVRSDLDCLIDADESYKTLSQIREIIEEAEQKTHVKIEPNIWIANESFEARTQRMHDRLFSVYLANAIKNPTWSIGKQDEKIIQIAQEIPSGEQLRSVVLGYLIYKHRGITTAPLHFDDDKSIKAMQRVLELPKSLGRKASQLCVLLEKDGFKEERSLFDHVAEDEKLPKILTDLGAIDKEYTEYVEELAIQVNELRPEDTEEYKKWLADRYKKAMPLGLAAVHGFSEAISSDEELILAR